MPSRIGNFFMKMLVNSPLYPFVGRNIAVITVTGCKTGNSIETPVNVVRLGDTLIVISLRNRTWWRNLRGGRLAQLRYIGRLLQVQGEVVEIPDEVSRVLMDYFTQYPGYAKYFNIRLEKNQKPNLRELERASLDRVIIKLQAI